MISHLSEQPSSHAISAYVCGLDVHRDSTYATVLGLDGGMVARGRVRNEDFPCFLEPLGVDWVAMEASTSIAPLFRGLTEDGYDITVSNPRKTRFISEAHKRAEVGTERQKDRRCVHRNRCWVS